MVGGLEGLTQSPEAPSGKAGTELQSLESFGGKIIFAKTLLCTIQPPPLLPRIPVMGKLSLHEYLGLAPQTKETKPESEETLPLQQDEMLQAGKGPRGVVDRLGHGQTKAGGPRPVATQTCACLFM